MIASPVPQERNDNETQKRKKVKSRKKRDRFVK